MHICVIFKHSLPKSMSDMFEVASILSRRNDKNGNHQYLVEWKGYPREDATWEPLDSLQSIKALVKLYDQKIDNPNMDQKAIISSHHSKKAFLKEKIQEKNKFKKQSKPTIKIQPTQKIGSIIQNEISSQEYNVNDQKKGKFRKISSKPKNQEASVPATSKSESSVIFSKKLMERLKNMQKKMPQPEQIKSSKKIIDVEKEENQESVEVLKMVYKQGCNKKLFELRIGDRITQLDLPHVKLMYPKALCEFYQRIFRIEI